MYEFPKQAHLKRRQCIDALWAGGSSLGHNPLRLRWMLVGTEQPEAIPILTGVSAPKKMFRKAVARNRTKRLLRECWRHAQPPLLQMLPLDFFAQKQLHLFWIYSGPELPEYENLQLLMHKIITSLVKKLLHEVATHSAHSTAAGTD